MSFAAVNYPAIIAAAVAGWLIGGMYYGALGKPWVAALGTTMEEFKARQAAMKGSAHAWLPFVLSFVADLIMAFVLAGLIGHIGVMTPRAGIITGVLVWLGFVVTTLTTNYAFGGRKYMLTVIDCGHWLAVLVAMGALLGAWAA